MKVVVTGNEGYIGSVLTEQLLQIGYDVIGIDCGYFPRSLAHVKLLQDDLRQIRKDVRDVEEGDLRGADAVVHLAALSNDPIGELNPEWTMQINHQATVRLAEIAKAAGVRRFVFSSSCSVYGAREGVTLAEDSEPIPITAYAKSKVKAEKDLLPMASESFSPVILRSATAYGVSPSMRLDLVVNNLAACAHATHKIVLLSDGTAWRPQVHIRDIGLAVQKCLEAPVDQISGEVFNVGENSENYTVREIAGMATEAFPGSKIEFDPKAGKDARSYRVEFSKIGKTLGFKPLWTVRKGLEEIKQTLSKFQFGPEQFESIEFYRVRYMKHLLEEGRVLKDLRLSSKHV